MFDESKVKRDEKGRFAEQNVQKIKELEKKFNDDLEDDKNRLSSVIEKKRRGEEIPRRLIVTNISDRAKKAIENLIGRPINALYHTLDIDEINHIEKRHGVKGKHDKSMASIEDYKLIVDVLHNFDNVSFLRNEKGDIVYSHYTDKNNTRALMLSFSKIIGQKEKLVVEAVTDGKSKNLMIISSYIHKIDKK